MASSSPPPYAISYMKPFGCQVVWQTSESMALVAETEEMWVEIAEGMESDEGQGVLCIRNLDLDPFQLEIVLERLGKAKRLKMITYDRWPGQSPGVEGCKHLALLGNYKARKANDFHVACQPGDAIAEFKPATMQVSEWHTDGSFLKVPKAGVALYAPVVEGALPEEGGETRFASCVRGLESLRKEDPDLYETAKKTKSVHSWEVFMRFLEAKNPSRPKVTAEQCAAKPDQAWPIVRAAGKVECLYVNPKNTRPCEISVEDLAERIIDSGVYAHKWKPGDLVMWNNERLLHAATPFDHLKYERLLFRVEFEGEPVLPPYQLSCSPDTVSWGYLDPLATPKLTVPSGAVVTVDTVSGGPEVLPPENSEHYSNIPAQLKEIQEKCGPDRLGPHLLTGPIYVESAEPGDLLQIDILDTKLSSDWAWTFVPKRTGGGFKMLSGRDFLCEEDTDKPRHTKIDPGAGWAYPEWGGKLDCEPFFGVLGVAPKEGRVNSIPPSDEYGGNLDLKLLTKGATLTLPVQAPGALLFVGDGHARQGDGECCGTALETALTGTLKLTVIKKAQHQKEKCYPRAETARDLIAIACQPSLDEAVAAALERMVDWLQELRPKLNRLDAYCLCSTAADVRITQFVNGNVRGAHVVLKKKFLPPPS